MHRQTVRRGAAALVLAGGLAIAGARPAAAAGPGPLSRETGWFEALWGEIVERSGLREGIGSVVSFWEAATGQTEQGFGLDPNGHSITIGPPLPSGDNG